MSGICREKKVSRSVWRSCRNFHRHSHPHYVSLITEQLGKIGFYSNSIYNPLQQELADKLGNLSGYADYQLFLYNSGAKPMKMPSSWLHLQPEEKIISYKKGFHGRTSAAVAITDNPKIIAPVNETENAVILPFNDLNATGNPIENGESGSSYH